MSVGSLMCGRSVQTTCFFIKPDKIITNYHVVGEIEKHNKIKVSFDYLRDDESTANQVENKEGYILI